MKSLKFLLVLLLSAGFMTGCFEEREKRYQGDTVVAFSPIVGTSNTYARTLTVPANANANTTIQVQLVGPHQSSDTVVNFEVSGTATSGTQYTITGNSVTIPANSSFGEIPLTAISAGLTAGQTRTVIVTITGGTFAPAERYKTFTLTLSKAAS